MRLSSNFISVAKIKVANDMFLAIKEVFALNLITVKGVEISKNISTIINEEIERN